MLRTLALAGAVALLTATSASAGGNATASLTSASAARHAGLTLTLKSATLRCGRLSAKSLSLTLPRGMHVPASIPRDTVWVGGQRAAAVRTNGTKIVLTLAAQHGMVCDAIVIASLRVQLTRAAGLVTPSRAGTYAFSVAATPRGGAWHGTFVVR
jgi:hypothetical protein